MPQNIGALQDFSFMGGRLTLSSGNECFVFVAGEIDTIDVP